MPVGAPDAVDTVGAVLDIGSGFDLDADEGRSGFEVSRFKVSSFEVSCFEVSCFEVSCFEVSRFEVSTGQCGWREHLPTRYTCAAAEHPARHAYALLRGA